jgi:DnaK suppressor protein
MFVIVDKKKTSGEAADYMNGKQIKSFEALLLRQREALYAHVAQINIVEREEMSDPVDKASQEVDRKAEALGFDRALQQIREINQALERIKSGDYGYCEDTGEPIGAARLLVMPTARLSVDAQSARERKKKVGLS